MKKYRIRFNKTRGQPGRGTVDHVWRVFEDQKEYLFKNLDIRGRVLSEKDANGNDYNIVCFGSMVIDKSASTAIIYGATCTDAQVSPCENLVSSSRQLDPPCQVRK